MEPIRVLQIISGFAVEGPLGGIERFGIALSRGLKLSHVEPILCGLWRYNTPYEEQWITRLQGEGIRAFIAADWDEAHPYHSFFYACRRILQQLAGQKVQLIHSHCQFGDGVALLGAHPLHARAIIRTVHNEREWPKRPGRRLILTNLLYPLLFHLEIGVSQKVKENLDHRPIAQLLSRKSICIYNAINLDRFSTSMTPSTRYQKRKELAIPATAPVVGTIGRITHQKGYSILLEAATLVLAELPSVHFLIVGGGELEDELKEQARQLGLAQTVHFLGPRQDVEGLLATIDLFVSSSLWEGLPTVILESMASKTPVVATDVSGTRELVEDGVTGLLVPPGNTPDLARAMLRMLRDQVLVKAMADQAYSRVQDFTITRVSQQYTEVYRKILGRLPSESSN